MENRQGEEGKYGVKLEKASGVAIGDNSSVTVVHNLPPLKYLVGIGIVVVFLVVFFVWNTLQAGSRTLYLGRVIDQVTEKPLRAAKVTLDVAGVSPPVEYTDTEGVFRFSLQTNGKTTQIRIRVELEGYISFDRFVTLSQEQTLEDVRIRPLVSTDSRASSAAQTLTPTAVHIAGVCNESKSVSAPNVSRFIRTMGLSAFTRSNTLGAVLSDRVRSLAIDQRGVWIGYFAADGSPSGVGQYDGKRWVDCNQSEATAGKNVNAMVVDKTGKVWLGAEKGGIAMFDGSKWVTFGKKEGLPSDEIFGLTVDSSNNIWAATWEGVAKYDGNIWSIPYSVQNNTIFNNHIHAITFDGAGNIWIGHIAEGVSQFKNSDGKWVHLTTASSKISGNQIRSIVVRKNGQTSESIWFATADGGISKFEQGNWTSYRIEDGLPSNEVRALAIDKYNRVWAATSGGVVYYNGSKWLGYDTLDTFAIAFGPTCQGCPFDDEHVWTGTFQSGLTNSRIPYDSEAIDIVEVKYPQVVAPGAKFRPEIVVVPRAPYQLREDRGDFLSHVDENDADRFGAWVLVPVKGIIDPGRPFTFTDYDNLFTAPQLAKGQDEKIFTSTWRVWMSSRFVGLPIRITFTVKRP